jgi:hypothetical protein
LKRATTDVGNTSGDSGGEDVGGGVTAEGEVMRERSIDQVKGQVNV